MYIQGQVLRRLGGTKPVVVIKSYDIFSDTIRVKYLGCGVIDKASSKKFCLYEYDLTCEERYQRDRILEEFSIEPEGEMNMATTKLYEVKNTLSNTIRFATKLAVNSDGLWVMEDKSTKEVFTTRKEHAEEVMPYTIDVSFENNSRRYSYFAEKGQYSVGDFFIASSREGEFKMVRVDEVDTKSRSATKDFKPLGKINVDKVV